MTACWDQLPMECLSEVTQAIAGVGWELTLGDDNDMAHCKNTAISMRKALKMVIRWEKDEVNFVSDCPWVKATLPVGTGYIIFSGCVFILNSWFWNDSKQYFTDGTSGQTETHLLSNILWPATVRIWACHWRSAHLPCTSQTSFSMSGVILETTPDSKFFTLLDTSLLFLSPLEILRS